MSNSIRFLGFAILAWAAVRAFTLVPGAPSLGLDASAAQQPASRLPPIEPSLLPPIEPMPSNLPRGAMMYGPPGYYPAYAPYPVYVPVPAAASRSSPPQIIYVSPPPPETREVNFYGVPVPQGSPPQELALSTGVETVPARQSTPSFETSKRPKWLDRLSMSGWAMMREESGPQSLAGRGTLGGSEVGARLLWRFDPRLAASLRFSAPVNSQRGGEAALGVRYQPFADWPVALTIERRQRIRDYGQNAFASFAEGGIYGQQLPWRSTLDGYFQAGVVDFNDPDWFVDGQVAVTRPVWRRLSAGGGIWGGAQPGLYRLDVGPRMTMGFGRSMRMHLDYRLNVVGNAAPGSGAVVTLAGDF